MLAALSGSLALVLGLVLLLLPLLITEMSRPGDPEWGAVVLMLGLALVTSADRLTGAPMVAVLSGALVVGRLSVEVARGRWNQLSEAEQHRLSSTERWRCSGAALAATLLMALERAQRSLGGLGEWLAERRRDRPTRKWVRPEAAATASSNSLAEADPGGAPTTDGEDSSISGSEG